MIDWERVARTRMDSTQIAILEAFDAEGGRVLSPKELSRELDEPLPTVAHHVRRLAAMELLEPARTRPSRGSLEHFYRLVARR
jgi:DNA-binding MarR family transcriptional regulator